MQTVILVLHLMIAAGLVGVVLLQRSEGGALGIGGGGGGGGFLTGRGTANLLTRVTAGLAAAFFVTSLTLTILAQGNTSAPSVVGRQPATPVSAPTPGSTAPAAPGSTAPTAPAPAAGSTAPAPAAPGSPAPTPGVGKGGVLDRFNQPAPPAK